MISIKSKIPIILFGCLLMLPAFWKLFYPGFFPMHDDTQPVRIFEMAKALGDGRFPVRWVPDLGYGLGYPLFNFYAPLPYYVGSFFALAGVDVVGAAKLMIAIGIILAGLSMFCLGKIVSKSTIGAFLISILYVYAPYHAVQVYVRGAIGELYSYAFLPIYFIGIVLVFNFAKLVESEKNIRLGVCVGSIGLAGVLLSHNIIGFLTVFFSFIFLLGYSVYSLCKNNFVKIIPFFMILLIGLGISAFFTIPAFGETQYTSVNTLITGGSNFHFHFLYLDQLWDSPWGFGGSAQGRQDGMSFKIGKIQLLLGLISILFFIFLLLKKKLRTKQSVLYLGLIVLFFVSLFFMLDASAWVYEIIPGFAYIQYPWRFLVFALFSLSLLPLVLLSGGDTRVKTGISIFAILVIILVNAKYFTPQQILPVSATEYINIIDLHNTYSKISDEYMPREFIRPQSFVGEHPLLGEKNDSFVYEITRDTPFEKITKIRNKKTQRMSAEIAYFPGWKAFMNDMPVPVNNVKGKISFIVPIGEYFLKLKLEETPLERLSNAISIFSVVLLVYVSLFGRNVMVWVQKHQ